MAVIAFFTAAIGAAAALRKDARLAVLFSVLFACRGIWCCGEVAWALVNAYSCQAWSLSKSVWLPIVTLADVVVFAGLALKFARSIHHPRESRIRFAGKLWPVRACQEFCCAFLYPCYLAGPPDRARRRRRRRGCRRAAGPQLPDGRGSQPRGARRRRRAARAVGRPRQAARQLRLAAPCH